MRTSSENYEENIKTLINKYENILRVLNESKINCREINRYIELETNSKNIYTFIQDLRDLLKDDYYLNEVD